MANPKKPKTADEINEDIQVALKDFVVRMSEYVSSIQILATKLESDGSTTGFVEGSGDLYARRGLANEFMVQGDE